MTPSQTKRGLLYSSLVLATLATASMSGTVAHAEGSATTPISTKINQIASNAIDEVPLTSVFQIELSADQAVTASESLSDVGVTIEIKEPEPAPTPKAEPTPPVSNKVEEIVEPAQVEQLVQAPAEEYVPQPTVVTPNYNQNNTYPVGQCTWGAKVLAPWVGNYWGNAGDWGYSAQAAGFRTGTTPVVGAVAVWTGGYGHVAVVTEVQGEMIRVQESNYNGNMYVSDFRGLFNPYASWGAPPTLYIYPPGA